MAKPKDMKKMSNKKKLDECLRMNQCQIDQKLSKIGVKIRLVKKGTGSWVDKKCEDMEPDMDMFYGEAKQ